MAELDGSESKTTWSKKKSSTGNSVFAYDGEKKRIYLVAWHR